MAKMEAPEATFGGSCSMGCGIVKMHYRPCGMDNSPVMEDLSKWLQYFCTEVATVERPRKMEPIGENNSADAQKHSNHSFRGGYRVVHSCCDFICGHAPYLPVIVMLQKPRLVTGHGITEPDSLLAFQN
jgi:hypothetical protein